MLYLSNEKELKLFIARKKNSVIRSSDVKKRRLHNIIHYFCFDYQNFDFLFIEYTIRNEAPFDL